uniref:A disintegrin and metalloproteinase with thrombospondin motifs 9 n=2 Tax=Clytia hemisphaerica TaxID=252671 RepID=A0A7M5V8I3_9CNID
MNFNKGQIWYFSILIIRTCITLLSQLPLSLSDDIKDWTLVYSKELTCLQANERLLALEAQQTDSTRFNALLLDCSRINQSAEQKNEEKFTDSKSDHNRLRKDDRRLENVIFYELRTKSGTLVPNRGGMKNIKDELLSNTESIVIQLKRNSEFLSPSFLTERRLGDLYTEGHFDENMNQCFYTGVVLGDNKSSVTLNICEGMQGVIRTSQSELLISPTPEYTSTNPEHHLYAAKFDTNKTPSGHDGSNKKKESPCPLSGNRAIPKLPNEYKFSYDTDGNLRLSLDHHGRSRARRSLSVKRHIETLLVADETMFEYYGRKEETLQRYLLSIMAIVTTLMKDQSIGNYVDVSVIKLIILKKNPHGLNVTKNASKSLKSFCEWQQLQNKGNNGHPEHFDTAILVTRNNLCSGDDKCETLGLAELGSICDPVRSCSVVEDNGLSVAFTIAHEVGHLLNAPHDGESNTCNELNDQVHIMTPTFSIKYKTWTWSSCSRKYITEFIESSDALCLLDKPSKKIDHQMPLKLPGELFSRKQQCQLVYGKNSTDCLLVDKCDRLWCECYQRGRKSCKTNNMPWADGTTCGKNKWCIQGHCRHREKLKPVHGNWGAWGAYNQCSRPCGGGIKYATRECDNPKPSYNGDYCIGQRRKYKSCNTQTCKNQTVDFREEQCAAFNGKDLYIHDFPKNPEWIPKHSGLNIEDSCKLFCEIKGSGIFYQLKSKVIDGTKCRKGSNDKCVDGKCRPAGCDNVLDSNAKVDKCGVCKGDNSACRIFTGTKEETIMGYNSVVRVPRGASRLKVVQVSSNSGDYDTNFLALLDHKERYIFNGDWRISLGRRRYWTYGTGIYYSGPNSENETIWMPGPLNSPVAVKILSIAATNNVKIRYSYTFPISSQQQSYQWIPQQRWSECFPACNGHQIRDFVCKRSLDGQIVASSKCSRPKPVARHRTCNFDCELMWRTQKGQCIPLKTCGNGIQKQTSMCTKVYVPTSNKKDEALSSIECRKAKIGQRPPTEIPCFVKCTSMRWVYTPWSRCDVMCGGGHQMRIAKCVDQTTNTTTADFNCNSTDKASLTRMCNTHHCPKWHAAWSESCSVTCGKGVIQRQVFCMIDDRTVLDNKCNQVRRPSKTKPCKARPCASWATKKWSTCSRSCGTGTQTRKVFCQTTTGQIVDEERCEAVERPSDRRRCFEKACKLKVKLTQESVGESAKFLNVKWLSGAWGKCSRTCGHGYRERITACVSNNAIVTDSYCDPSKKPVSRELCNTFPCPFWRHGAWSKCTLPCGNGTQTRLVLCGFNGAIVSNMQCDPSQKPSDRRRCNQHRCPEAMAHDPPPVARATASHWRVTMWSECSTTCGVGHQTRSVECSNHEECEQSRKPISIMECNKGACPGWNYGQWTPCRTERGCGKGLQLRLVVCQLEDGRVLPNKGCDAQHKPLTNRTCELLPCQQQYKWHTTGWEECNVQCSHGFQYRHVTCHDEDGHDSSETNCLKYDPKPDLQKACERPACPLWKTEDWGECDVTCIQQRNVYCARDHELVDPSTCRLQTKPIEQQECHHENCVRIPVYSWKVGKWGNCGASCGYSLKARGVDCIDEAGRPVNDTLCKGRMPKMVEQCFMGTCPPEWVAEPWTECSKKCGKGVQEREVFCQGMVSSRLPDTACDVQKKLPTIQECNLGNCDQEARWMAGDWLKCSRSCGIGEVRRDVRCVDRRNNTVLDSSCPKNTMPVVLKVCNTHSCPRESCRDVQRDFDIKFDGEHTLQVPGGTLSIFCEGMHRNNPKEFITLKSDPRENYSEIFSKRLRNGRSCPNNGRRQQECEDCIDYPASGVTFFKKVRIDIKRMTLIPEDMTFADRYGRNPPGFASAGDCYSRIKCAQGRFMVNLLGTGLKVQEGVMWASRGYHTSQKIRRHKDGQVVYGICGGYCGMCAPANRNGLEVKLYSLR